MRIELDERVRDAAARALARHLKAELDVDVGGMDAVRLIDFLAETLGPHFYNQGLRDARARRQAKLDALDDAFYELEKPARL